MIPCGDKPMRQLSFKKDTHAKLSVQCSTHIKYSKNDVSIICLSISTIKLVFISMPTYCCHTQSTVGAAGRSLHGNPKANQSLGRPDSWNERPGTSVDHSNW